LRYSNTDPPYKRVVLKVVVVLVVIGFLILLRLIVIEVVLVVKQLDRLRELDEVVNEHTSEVILVILIVLGNMILIIDPERAGLVNWIVNMYVVIAPTVILLTTRLALEIGLETAVTVNPEVKVSTIELELL
jgi:hypothetical protein